MSEQLLPKLESNHRSFKMLTLILSAALMMTLLLLALMTLVIYGGDFDLNNASRILHTDIIMPKKQIDTFKKVKKSEKPDIQNQETPPIPEAVVHLEQVALAAPKMEAPTIESDFSLSLGAFSNADGEYLPLVKVAPVYPQRALMRNIEGYVLVEFTVNADGSVSHPIVLESEPQNVFERAALSAVMNFKYQPKMLDGVAIAVPKVQNRFVFSLED